MRTGTRRHHIKKTIMRLKKTIKLLVPPIIPKMMLRMRKASKNTLTESPLPQIQHHSNKIILIGNGPSLTKTVELYKDEIIKNDRIAANFFASSDYYEQLRPNIYLFADPAFFEVPDNQKKSIATLFDALINKTSWPLNLIVPFAAKDAPLLATLKKNSNIRIDYYFISEQNVGAMPLYDAWDKNFICPPFQNVMNVAIYLSLFWGYQETYLVGVDMSSLEDIRVDQETNELFSIDRHFYNNKDVYSDKKLFDDKRGRIRSDWKLHEYIYAFGRMFECFYELKKYADYKGLKIYNASEYSWINVFERRKLK